MNNKEFDDIYKLHSEYIYRFILNKVKFNETLAEELCQETFIRAYKFLINNSINLDTTRSWLCSIAGNIVIDHFRKIKRQNNISLDQLFEDPDSSSVLESNFNMSSVENSLYLRENLDIALKILKNKSSEVFSTFMTYLETDDYQLTSKIEDICIGTTKSRIFRARKILKENLPHDLVALKSN